MKKVVLAVVLLAAITIVEAQNGNNICVWNAIKAYTEEGGSSSELESGVKCSDEAIANESTMNLSKTWYYRAKLYRAIATDTILNKKYGTAPMEGIKAFKKLNEINDPKFKEWNDACDQLEALGNVSFNTGVVEYHKKNYAQAAQYFYNIKDINAILSAHKRTPKIDIGLALQYAAQAAQSSGDKKLMVDVCKDWLAVEDSANVYYYYGVALRANGDTVQAKKVMSDGLAKFPKDQNLLREKVIALIDLEKYEEAIQYINGLLANDPKLDGAWFLKGLAYFQSGKSVDSAISFYNKAIEINPKSTNSYNNLGAIYVNQAKIIYDDMSKLGNSAADTKKYNEMTQQIKVLYLKAKPFLEKVKELSPGDESINRTLYKINAFLDSNK
jgi:tetratricopeptide (TPR) repeat protein